MFPVRIRSESFRGLVLGSARPHEQGKEQGKCEDLESPHWIVSKYQTWFAHSEFSHFSTDREWAGSLISLPLLKLSMVSSMILTCGSPVSHSLWAAIESATA